MGENGRPYMIDSIAPAKSDTARGTRAILAASIGNIFPQTQNMDGDYQRHAVSAQVANRQATPQLHYGQWDYGFNMAWELDFWGRFRRAVEAARGELDASVENYDDALVTLLGDVATSYTQYRTTEQRIRVARQNVALQRKTLQIVEGQLKAGIVGELDVAQARSTLAADTSADRRS